MPIAQCKIHYFGFNWIACFLMFSFASKDSLRCLAFALKRMPLDQQTLSPNDEANMTYIGMVWSASFSHDIFSILIMWNVKIIFGVL